MESLKEDAAYRFIKVGETMTKEEIKFAIEYLNKIMPEWDYEANMHCPDAYHGLGELICAEPEGYVYKTAIEALEKVDKYRWHDLRKNPKDLPNDNRRKLVIVHHSYECDDWAAYDLSYYSELTYKWVSVTYNSSAYRIIAWREIEPFEGDEE